MVGWLVEGSKPESPPPPLYLYLYLWCWCARAAVRLRREVRRRTDAVGVAGLLSRPLARAVAPVLSKVISLHARCHSIHMNTVAHGCGLHVSLRVHPRLSLTLPAVPTQHTHNLASPHATPFSLTLPRHPRALMISERARTAGHAQLP